MSSKLLLREVRRLVLAREDEEQAEEHGRPGDAVCVTTQRVQLFEHALLRHAARVQVHKHGGAQRNGRRGR